MRAWAAPPTLHIAGLRVKERVYVRATHYARHRCAQNADHLAHNTPFSAFFTEVVCVLGAAPPQAATSQPQNGGNDAIQASDTPVTRRQRASHGAKPPLPPTKQPHEGPQGEAAVPEGDGRARPSFEATHRHTPAHQAPLVWRAPEDAGGPGCGTRGRRRGLAGLRDDAPSRRLAARAARGRAAAHGGIKQPGPRDRPRGARNTSGAQATTRENKNRRS